MVVIRQKISVLVYNMLFFTKVVICRVQLGVFSAPNVFVGQRVRSSMRVYIQVYNTTVFLFVGIFVGFSFYT